MPIVDVPGVGSVEFPDSMKVEQIQAEAGRLSQIHSGQNAAGPNPMNPLAMAGLGAGAGALAVGGGLAAKEGLSKLPPALQALARFAGRQIPGMHQVSDLKNLAQGMMGGPPPLQAPESGNVIPASPSRGRIEVTKGMIKKFPALKHFNPGETISQAKLDAVKIRAASESGPPPTRKINVQGKPAARAPAQTAEPPYTGGRGASGPELERRAAAMARAGGPPNLSLVPQEMPQIPPAQDLEGQLRQALAAEQAMGAQGLAPAERVGLRAGLRSALPPALEALTFLLGSQQVPQQMEEARRQYLQGAHPDLYRMLYENPNQHIPGGT